MRVLLALSGGVDSSTLAHLLKEEGHDVVAVRFTLWTDPLAPALAEILPSKCCTTQNIARAATVAKNLGIPLHVVDLTEEFKREVVDPFLMEHTEGRTPNPCIGCNRSIKFGHLLRLMDELHCDKLVTGHYARTASETLTNGQTRAVLLEALDSAKDQSYYLYGLTQEQLARVLFPLGNMKKSDVYALAAHYGVPLPEQYQESQDLCFFPEKTPKEFLKRHLGSVLAQGPIVRRDNTIVGTHEGLPLYTVGQRRGLRIGGLKVPLEVVEKNPANNTLIVEEKNHERWSKVTVRELRWISWVPSTNAAEVFSCRTRSLSPRHEGTFTHDGVTGTFTFATPVHPQAAGQSLVLYRGKEIIGGGVMIGKAA
jgi:tRNA-specific 2-thiouridylase